MSTDSHSREGTPSSISSPSTQQSTGMEAASSLTSEPRDDAERFRKRLELEQTMQVLQQRLELANLKAKNGWTEMSISEIENNLSPKRRRENVRFSTGEASPSTVYPPPSPSRPWQLVDVLWQPLPPPSRGYPTSPNSPLRRSRDDEKMQRRASGSTLSPIDRTRREKKRSQSHSHARIPPTKQDFNAARTLTELLSASPSDTTFQKGNRLPLPPAFSSRPKRSSSIPPKIKVDEEDKNAAELMMYLAQSPPAVSKTRANQSKDIGSTARVLFMDEKEGKDGKREERSNLGLMPPITAGDSFGGLL